MSGNLEPRLFESTVLKSDKGCHRTGRDACLLLWDACWDARIPFHLFVKFSTAVKSGSEKNYMEARHPKMLKMH
jgi:hypothetical protein